MKNTKTKFATFAETLPLHENQLLEQFFSEFDSHFLVSKKSKKQFRGDFEAVIMLLYKKGVPMEEILERIALSNLGGFYARPSVMWFPLDNAAKIYPISMEHGSQQVFRLAVYFKEDVIPELLQMALTFTIKRYSSFATTLKKGFFWHYLDMVKRRFSIEEEHDVPCQPIKVSMSGSQSFRLMYYKNRVSAEFFHVLTDGTGAMTFFKSLISEYLRLCGVKAPLGDIWDVNETPVNEEFENAFAKVEKAKNRATKEAMIWEDEMNLANSKKDNNKSMLLPLVSSCVNHPGFKYKLEELKDMGIVQFMDSVQRLQIYESTTALMSGMYSGMIDVKGLGADALNFMRSIETK